MIDKPEDFHPLATELGLFKDYGQAWVVAEYRVHPTQESIELIKAIISTYVYSELPLPPVLAMFHRAEMKKEKPFALPKKRGRPNSIEAMMKRGVLHIQAAELQEAGMSVEKSHEEVAKNNAASFDTVKGADQGYKKDSDAMNREVFQIMCTVDKPTADAIRLQSSASFKRFLDLSEKTQV